MSRLGLVVLGLATAALAAAAIWLVTLIVRGTLIALTLPTFGALHDAAWVFLSFCIAVGALSMIFVQISRLLYPFRGRFHQRALRDWFLASARISGHHPDSIKVRKKFDIDHEPSAIADMALLELQRLPSDESRSSRLDFYDLPLEQLCGQVGSDADLLLDQPRSMPHLAICLVGAYAHDLLALVTAVDDLSGSAESDDPTESNDPAEAKSLGDWDGPAQSESAALKATEARARLAREIQRRIDAFQIAAGGTWRRSMRSTVLVVSLGFGWLITFSSMPAASSPTTVVSYAIYSTLAGILGAFIAMLLRDLTAIVELRRRQA